MKKKLKITEGQYNNLKNYLLKEYSEKDNKKIALRGKFAMKRMKGRPWMKQTTEEGNQQTFRSVKHHSAINKGEANVSKEEAKDWFKIRYVNLKSGEIVFSIWYYPTDDFNDFITRYFGLLCNIEVIDERDFQVTEIHKVLELNENGGEINEITIDNLNDIFQKDFKKLINNNLYQAISDSIADGKSK